MTPPGDMTVQEFIAKWQHVELSERAASQEHFIDLCHLLGQPTPAEHDKSGSEYTFEKSVAVTSAASKGSAGAGGFADVWWRGKFGWEYKRKGKHKDLTDAYRQICQYREALDNPPLLVVCDIAHTEIHTNFTGTAKQVHTVDLVDLDQPGKLDLLRRVFTNPESFRPGVTREDVTNDVAAKIGTIAQALRDRGHDPHDAAHFLMKCMFCLFAEDIDLLPDNCFTTLLEHLKNEPDELQNEMDSLFAAMKTGGRFLLKKIEYFNGGLFERGEALQLEPPEIAALLEAARQDWSAVEPAIFGTLFERSLDPSKRAQIGAHYTSRDDIMLIVEPVVMAPLRKQWQVVQDDVHKQLDRRHKATTDATKRKANDEIANLLRDFLDRLSQLRILDPACGSGNFLYVAIQELLFLEKEVIRFAAGPDIQQPLFPTVRPTQLHGIEVNPYAAELAQVVIWIGYLQWMRDNGFNVPRDPILEPLRTIENRDAILAWQHDGQPIATWQSGATCLGPATWPRADFIIGNPPFLGGNLIRKNLGDAYVEAMFENYEIPNYSDLCCYWFERARQQIEERIRHGEEDYDGPLDTGPLGLGLLIPRAGLLATQGIRGGANRKVLERIKDTGDIFMAHADREWILDGAAVHVSMVGFSDESDDPKMLDGSVANDIFSDLTGGLDLSATACLLENAGIAFRGIEKGGAFDVPWTTASEMLSHPNSTAQGNSDVLHPYWNGMDLTRRFRSMWLIDFEDMPLGTACAFERPFSYIEREVKPARLTNREKARREHWWLHGRSRPEFREAARRLHRVAAIPHVAKHFLVAWLAAPLTPDHQLIAVARSDDYFFGVLHSSVHELWARRQGTQLREAESGFRYTPTTCFETFALPWRPGEEDFADPLVKAIGEAAAELNEQRERWLNPPEWIEPLAAQIDAEDDFADVEAVCGPEARALIRESAIMAAAAKDENLKKRTLTNLYNERPTWLKLAHRTLDEAVLAAYAAVDPDGGWDASWAEVWEPSGAGQPLEEGHELAERRGEIDQAVLGNLLRLNLARAEGA